MSDWVSFAASSSHNIIVAELVNKYSSHGDTDELYVTSILEYLLDTIVGYVVDIFLATYFVACVVGDILGAWLRVMGGISVGFNVGLFESNIVRE